MCVGGGGCCGGGGGGGEEEGQFLRTALHTISISLQNSFCELHTWRLVSCKALRELNARWALPVYPVFEEKSKASDEKSVKRKIAYKKSKRTNIIATNLDQTFKSQIFDIVLRSLNNIFFKISAKEISRPKYAGEKTRLTKT